MEEVKSLAKKYRILPSVDYNYPLYKRLAYVRYADK
jgi:hypothetical protein